MSVLGWWIVTSSGLSLAAISVLGIARFFHPGFAAHSYQKWLVYVAVAIITSEFSEHLCFNIASTLWLTVKVLPLFVAPKKINVTVQITLFLSLVGAFLTFVIVLAMRQQEEPGSFIVESNLGRSGWSSGTAWTLGITNAMYTFGGLDGVIHISEELVEPGRRVPQVMAATLVIGLVTTLPLFLALMFCVKDIDAVTNSPLPSLEIIFQV